MNYIITGGTGFIGTHLANLIKEQDENARVWNLDIVDPEKLDGLNDPCTSIHTCGIFGSCQK